MIFVPHTWKSQQPPKIARYESDSLTLKIVLPSGKHQNKLYKNYFSFVPTIPPPISPCCSALCLPNLGLLVLLQPPPSPFLPKINGHWEQNRAIPQENAPEENICQSFVAKSNRRPIPSCQNARPVPSPSDHCLRKLCQTLKIGSPSIHLTSSRPLCLHDIIPC